MLRKNESGIFRSVSRSGVLLCLGFLCLWLRWLQSRPLARERCLSFASYVLSILVLRVNEEVFCDIKCF